MAVGTTISNNNKKTVFLVDAATGNVAKPTATGAAAARDVAASATAGVPVYPRSYTNSIAQQDDSAGFVNRDLRESTLIARASGPGQVVVATLTLWGYLEALGAWVEIPTNGGTAVTPVALAETETDVITYFQRYQNLGHFDRLACEVAGLSASTTISVVLVSGVSGTAA